MLRSLGITEEKAALNLCHIRHPSIPASFAPCPTCRADIVRLVDAPPSALTAEVERLRAALTEREGECERLNADYTRLLAAMRTRGDVLEATDKELTALRQRVAEGEADTARVTCKHTGKIIRGYEHGYDMAWCDECGEITWCSDGSIPSYAHGFMQRTDWCKTRVVAYGCASEARGNLSKIQDGKLCPTWCGHDYCPVSLDAARGPRTEADHG